MGKKPVYRLRFINTLINRADHGAFYAVYSVLGYGFLEKYMSKLL